jgi:hypothetical protein
LINERSSSLGDFFGSFLWQQRNEHIKRSRVRRFDAPFNVIGSVKSQTLLLRHLHQNIYLDTKSFITNDTILH